MDREPLRDCLPLQSFIRGLVSFDAVEEQFETFPIEHERNYR